MVGFLAGSVWRSTDIERSAVERAIGHLKNWKILATGRRGRLAERPTVIRNTGRLGFYRLC